MNKISIKGIVTLAVPIVGYADGYLQLRQLRLVCP